MNNDYEEENDTVEAYERRIEGLEGNEIEDNCTICGEPYKLMGFPSIKCRKCGHRNY